MRTIVNLLIVILIMATVKIVLHDIGVLHILVKPYFFFCLCLLGYLKFFPMSLRFEYILRRYVLGILMIIIGVLALADYVSASLKITSLVAKKRIWLTVLVIGIPTTLFVLWKKLIHPKQAPRTFGTARWASKKEILWHQTGLLIGNYKKTFIRYSGEAHIITFANTGSGKGIGSVIPNLLDYQGSILCIDPKGENTTITARYRKEIGQEVYTFDPWGITGLDQASFNPLDWLDKSSPDLIDDARMLATTLVADVGVNEQDPHWNEEARELLAGLMVYVAIQGDGDKRTLITVRRYLNMKKSDLQGLLEHMSHSDAGDGYVASVANRMAGKNDREFASVMATLQRHTHFLDSPGIQKSLQPSSFNMTDIKKKAVTIYLVLPADKLTANARWLRLFVSMAVTAMARERKKPTRPVLFLLDEFAALGRLESISVAAGLMRGYGIKLWPILQDIQQLQAIYPDKWRSFLANAGCIQVFGVNDQTTADYVSEMLGQSTVTTNSNTTSKQSGLSLDSGSQTFGQAGRSLCTSDEVRMHTHYNQVVFINGQYPMLLGRIKYYDEDIFKGKYDRNPYL